MAVALLLLAIAAFVFTALQAPPNAVATSGASGGDLAMYGRLVARLQLGEPYYEAAHEELLAGNYGTRSVLNWRTPIYFTLVALAPTPVWAQGALVLLAVAAAISACLLFARDGGTAFGLTLAPLLLMSLAGVAAPDAVLMPEIATGILILLSASAYGLDRPWLGFAAAVVALLVRELAAPYILVCMWLAWRGGRRNEVVAWLGGLAIYALFYWWHSAQVLAVLGAADRAYETGWIQFGHLMFVLTTAAFNGVANLLPLWVTAIVLPLAILGLTAWRANGSTRVATAVAAYVILFAVVGKPFNGYWGAVYTPLLTLGLPWAIAGGIDLARGLAGRNAAA